MRFGGDVAYAVAVSRASGGDQIVNRFLAHGDRLAYFIAQHLPRALRYWVIVNEALLTAHEIHRHDLSEHPALADPQHPLHVHVAGITWEAMCDRLTNGESPIDRLTSS